MVQKLIYFIIILLFLTCSPKIENKELKIHIGDLISQKNLNFDYVEGNVIDCRNISIVYLKGDVSGDKNLNININIMKGNILANNVKVHILDGNILKGNNIKVNLLLGEDFTGKAEILKKIYKEIKF
jgi:hypothetical protein